MERITLTTKPQPEYELLDSGGEEKLERYGEEVLARPDPQALWEKKLGEGDHRQGRGPAKGGGWGRADATYVRGGEKGDWKIKKDLPKEWGIEFGNLKFLIKPTSFKHTGLFPEQLSNWAWIQEVIRRSTKRKSGGVHDSVATESLSSRAVALESLPQTSFGFAPGNLLLLQPKVLNLFAYTGGATLAAAQAGAEVTHVDASKTAVAWARENAKLSGLEDKPIRWIVEDVMVFVQREIKRGNKYDAVVMDPPAFGHGPKNELWKIEENFVELVKLCGQLLSDKPLFFLISGYAAGYSPLAFAYNLEFLQKKYGGEIEYGDLTVEESGNTPNGVTMRRLLPCGIFARCTF